MTNQLTELQRGVGLFAIVKLWPDIKTAEDECIARLKMAANALGVECVEVHSDGTYISDSSRKITRETVDFVIHLHYDTPKNYDAFSFVALWNPTRFYHEWGYARCSRNLTTHDDFLSCSSEAADDHVKRMVRRSHTHLPPQFNLYHSLPDIVHAPSLGDMKLFYAGINWEAIGGGRSRHQEVLRRLDSTGLIRIYGPTIFQGVRVWAGYESYVKEVPFDGISMIHEISRAGISLVLSSQAHKDSGLMSNRLFESIAAGALVICDENPFARKFFGDSLLYVDGRCSADQLVEDILRHLEWARENPAGALERIARAQDIFCSRFTLINSLRDIYVGLPGRKRQLTARMAPVGAQAVSVCTHFLMPEFQVDVLDRHIASMKAQTYEAFHPILVYNEAFTADQRAEIGRRLEASRLACEQRAVAFYWESIRPEIRARRNLGQVIWELLGQSSSYQAFMVVAPNEALLSNHVAVLASTLQRSAEVQCAATAALLLRAGEAVNAVHEVIDFGHVDRNGPPGLGRFIFRVDGISSDVAMALPYLDGRPLAVMIGSNRLEQQLPATIKIDLGVEYPERTWDEVAENEIIRDFSPEAFVISSGFRPSAIGREAQFAPAMSKQQLLARLSSLRWIKAQLRAVRRQGLAARIKVLKQKLGLEIV